MMKASPMASGPQYNPVPAPSKAGAPRISRQPAHVAPSDPRYANPSLADYENDLVLNDFDSQPLELMSTQTMSNYENSDQQDADFQFIFDYEDEAQMQMEAMNWPLTPPLTLNPPPNIPAAGSLNNGIVSPVSCAPAVHSPPKNLSRFSSSSSLPGLVHTSPHRRGSMAGERSLSTSRGPSPDERRNSKVKGQARIAKKPSRQYLRSKKSLINMAHEDLKSPPPSSDTASFSSAGTKSLTASSIQLNRQPRHFRSTGQFITRTSPNNMQTAAAATALYQDDSQAATMRREVHSMTPSRNNTSTSGNNPTMAPPTLTPNAMAAAAAAAAANHAGPASTPVRREPVYGSPSTIVVNSNSSTIQRSRSAHPLVQPSPTPAVRMHSSTRLVAAASDSSPAKGMFVQEKKKPVSAKKTSKSSKAIPEMSSAMSQFQVQLNTHPQVKAKVSSTNMRAAQQPSRMVNSSQSNSHMSQTLRESPRSLAASAAAAAAQPPPNMQPYYLNPGQDYLPKQTQPRQPMHNQSPARSRYGLGLVMDGPPDISYGTNEFVDFGHTSHATRIQNAPAKPHFAAQAGIVALNGASGSIESYPPQHHRQTRPPEQQLQPPPMMHEVLRGSESSNRMSFGIPPSWSPQTRGGPPPLASPAGSRSESLQSRVSVTSNEDPSWTVFSPSHFSGSTKPMGSLESLPHHPSIISESASSLIMPTQVDGMQRSQQTLTGLDEYEIGWNNHADEESNWDVMDLLKPEFTFD